MIQKLNLLHYLTENTYKKYVLNLILVMVMQKIILSFLTMKRLEVVSVGWV